MKKKVISVLVMGVFVTVLVVLGGKSTGTEPENETIVNAQGDDVATELTESEISGDNWAEEQEGDNSTVAESELNVVIAQEIVTEQYESDNPSSESGNKVNTALGNDLTHEESIVSNSGVDIPVLNKFNYAGLDPDCVNDDGMQDWFGYVGDADAPGYVNVTACADAMNELTEALDISGGFLPQQDHISFSFTDIYAETGDLELRRDFENGYYTIGINYDMSDSEAFYSVEDGKDALTLLCSVVSSTPSELAEFLYEESFVVEECMTSETEWITVGDCMVQWGGYDGNDTDVLVYRVKSK